MAQLLELLHFSSLYLLWELKVAVVKALLACVNESNVFALLDACVDIHCLRDLTRGGLASAVVEIAECAGLHIRLDESAIPVREDVGAACEILGFDPLYVANEGRFLAFVPAESADDTVAILRTFPVSAAATIVGTVSEKPANLVTLRSRIGATRVVDMLSGEQLPRIC